MASLILSTVGAAVGGMVAGPIGAFAGRLAGAIGGAALDQSLLGHRARARTVEGPRLSDLDVMGSTEGSPVPRVFGRARIAGEVIWATRLEEVVTSRSESVGGGSGGKGGGSRSSSSSTVTETTYSYYANLALGLCEGPIAGVGRVWADGKLLDLAPLTVRAYVGDETQTPDPLILAKEGSGGAPAYRGLAYLVLERLPLAAFGNRVPQIQVEVIRPVGRLERMLRAVTLIPGATEFGYDTVAVSRVTGPGSYAPENRHAPTAETDVVVALDRLQGVAPNLERVSLVVAWFGDDLRADQCTIAPRVDRADKTTTGDVWSVAGLTRTTARVVSLSDDRPAYGGTPSDASVIRLIRELKARGLKVTLTPFVMMDVPADNARPDPWTGAATQPAYPWRGRITCDPAPDRAGSPDGTTAAASQIAALFGTARAAHFAVTGDAVTYSGPAEWTLRRMVLHCAALAEAAGGVDALLIGSEYEALTRVRSAPGVYPAVTQLAALAAEVKALCGADTKVSYAANWSEYGAHVRGAGADVRFPLDPLWASPAIDMVAIDWYAPLADWRDGTHLDTERAATPHDRAYLAANIRGGEAFDWYYADDAARAAQVRTPISDPQIGKPWVFRQKDLVGWWSNVHRERVGGAELATPTAWLPQSKPIWLTELGCPAVDKGANRPSCFPDTKSSQGTLPPFSDGTRDDLIQRRVLEVALTAYDPAFGADLATNPHSSAYGGRMVDPSTIHLWTWDARPHPWFPRANAVWSDAPNWETGHWLNGRLGGAPLDGLAETLLADVGLAADTDGLTARLDGYVLDRPVSPRAALEPLADACTFVAIETADGVALRGRGAQPVATLTDDDLIIDKPDDAGIKFVRGQETELPVEVTLAFSDGEADYRRAAVRSRRLVGASRRTSHADLAIVSDAATAQRMAEIWLQDLWAGRDRVTFALPPSSLALTPGDVVRLVHRDREHLVEIDEIVDEATRRVSARSIDPDVFAVAVRSLPARAPEMAANFGPPLVHVLDLPALSASDPQVLQRLAVFADPWPGAMTVWRSTDGAAFEVAATATTRAVVGITLDPLPAGPLWRWDCAASLRVELAGGALSSLPDAAVLDGANAAALRAPDGTWEIIQFANAELVASSTCRLSRLLRGQRGSETAMATTLPVGSAFVLLDAALVPIVRNEDDVGRTLRWRIGPAGRDHADAATTEVVAPVTATALRPFAPVHVRATRTPAGVMFTWVRRTRIGGDAFDLEEVQLGEARESYSVDILDGAALKRTLQSDAPAVLYPSSEEIADFGAPQMALSIAVMQRSATAGRGFPTKVTLDVR